MATIWGREFQHSWDEAFELRECCWLECLAVCCGGREGRGGGFVRVSTVLYGIGAGTISV